MRRVSSIRVEVRKENIFMQTYKSISEERKISSIRVEVTREDIFM